MKVISIIFSILELISLVSFFFFSTKITESASNIGKQVSKDHTQKSCKPGRHRDALLVERVGGRVERVPAINRTEKGHEKIFTAN